MPEMLRGRPELEIDDALLAAARLRALADTSRTAYGSGHRRRRRSAANRETSAADQRGAPLRQRVLFSKYAGSRKPS